MLGNLWLATWIGMLEGMLVSLKRGLFDVVVGFTHMCEVTHNIGQKNLNSSPKASLHRTGGL